MDMKKIMLMTFLLLAVLTIGCVSAADDIASDNVTVSDDADIVANEYDPDDYYINVNEYEICIDENDEEYDAEYTDIASITLPKNAKGSFQILNKEDVVARLDVNKSDDDHWDVDDDEGTLEGTIYLMDFNLTKVHDGDILTFKFLELSGGELTPIESFTVMCKVSLTDTTLQLTQISSNGMTDEDVEFKVKDIDYNKPDENFTYVKVTQKDGFFIISIEGEEDIIIFRENLNTTKRHYVEIDENGTRFYRFGYSFNDINNYIAKNVGYAKNFTDLVEKEGISSEDEMYFGLYEDDEAVDDIYYETMIITLKKGGISFRNEDEDVDVDYGDLNIAMEEGWQETELLECIVGKEIKGKIVIYINNNTTPAFEKNITDLIPTEDEDDEDYNYYVITLRDLNITQAGEYEIRTYIYDEKGATLYEEDDDDPEILTLYEPQTTTANNITISVIPLPTTISSTESLIVINDSSASEEDEVLIYVDGNETPIKINITDCGNDENEIYFITAQQLNLGALNLEVGEHNLNITYKGVNSTGKFNLESNLVIEIEEEMTIYTTFNDLFVYIYLESLEEEDILSIYGIINLTIIDNAGNITATLEKDLDGLSYDNEYSSRIIRVKDLDTELSGNYTVIVRYFGGNEVATQTQGNVTFKSFESEDYGASIGSAIGSENDYAFTFKAIPLRYNIIIEVDGQKHAEINESDLDKWFNQEKGVYYIKYDKLNGLEDGTHSISAYIDTELGRIDLANGTVTVDLKENIDPALTIAVSNIEEGNAANVVISTNATFTGNVTVQVANENYTVNVINGQGSISITGLKANTYTATAIFKSDAIFKDSIKTTTFTVTSKSVTPPKKAKVIKLTLKKVKIKKSAKKLVLKATLKINGKKVKGKKITFKFKGKKYKGKTNKKGIAKVTIKKKVLKKLKVGKKITYTAKYSTKTVKKTVKIRK